MNCSCSALAASQGQSAVGSRQHHEDLRRYICALLEGSPQDQALDAPLASLDPAGTSSTVLETGAGWARLAVAAFGTRLIIRRSAMHGYIYWCAMHMDRAGTAGAFMVADK